MVGTERDVRYFICNLVLGTILSGASAKDGTRTRERQWTIDTDFGLVCFCVGRELVSISMLG
jgi:hypothetical protein